MSAQFFEPSLYCLTILFECLLFNIVAFFHTPTDNVQTFCKYIHVYIGKFFISTPKLPFENSKRKIDVLRFSFREATSN